MKKILRWAAITIPFLLAGCKTMLGGLLGVLIVLALAALSGCKLDDFVLIK